MSKQIKEYERQYLLQNMNNASYNREKKELYKRKEIENDKKALETLQQKIEEEKKLAYEKKRQIQSAQLKEYEDYINRKYHISRNVNESIDKSLQIKIGSENRYIKNTQDFRNKDYYDKSEVIDFSDKGKINQRVDAQWGRYRRRCQSSERDHGAYRQRMERIRRYLHGKYCGSNQLPVPQQRQVLLFNG